MPDTVLADHTMAICEVSPLDPPEALLAARYRGATVAATPAWNTVLSTMLAHRSVRSYTTEKLPEGTVETLVAAAQSAATSSNLQTWSVVAVTDPTRKAILAEVAGGQKHIIQAPVLLVWLADLNRLATVGAERGQPVEGLDYLETLFVGIIDAALAAQNATVAAESLGLGSVYLGLGSVYIGALRNDPERVAATIGLPPHVMAVFGMCVGYADPAVVSGVKPRLEQSIVLHHETYGSGASSPAVAAYDDAIQAFQREQRIAEVPWSKQALSRVAGPKSLSGRDRIKGALERLGFPMR
jgi:nitroreductase